MNFENRSIFKNTKVDSLDYFLCTTGITLMRRLWTVDLETVWDEHWRIQVDDGAGGCFQLCLGTCEIGGGYQISKN